MKILFRADASVQQGTGHIMRCLVIADELRNRGHECVLVTQPFLPGFLRQIENRLHKLVLLGKKQVVGPDCSMNDQYLMWLGRTVVEDALETLGVIENEQPDIVIADHYAIDATWMNIIRSNCVKTVTIDDLANREHVCDILIDQNFGRSSEHYEGLVPQNTKILAGAEYIFIVDDFRNNRATAQKNRLSRTPRRLNICMGGIDKDNATYSVLKTVMQLDCFKTWSVDIVVRSASPHSNMLREYVDNLRSDIKLHLDAENMALLFSKADLAIGAGGVTLWERCCMGLPTVLLTIADNQIPAALAVANTGAVLYATDIRKPHWEFKLGEKLDELARDVGIIYDMSRKAYDICDGTGLDKVCDTIELV